MRADKPVPRDKVLRLILLIAITFAVLSVVTAGPVHARFEHQSPAPTTPTNGHVSPKR